MRARCTAAADDGGARRGARSVQVAPTCVADLAAHGLGFETFAKWVGHTVEPPLREGSATVAQLAAAWSPMVTPPPPTVTPPAAGVVMAAPVQVQVEMAPPPAAGAMRVARRHR